MSLLGVLSFTTNLNIDPGDPFCDTSNSEAKVDSTTTGQSSVVHIKL